MVAVYRDVPATKTVEEEYTVMVPQTRVRTVADTINHPVYGSIELRTTTMTPRVESRRATYTVGRLVPVQEDRCESACCSTCSASLPPALPPALPPPLPATGGPDPNAPPPPPTGTPAGSSVAGGGCDPCCNACAPRKVCVTCWKPVSQQVTVQYPVTHLDPSSRFNTVPFYEYRKETKLRKESYVVEVPEKERGRGRLP